MGFTPKDVQAMTLEEFDACITGWNRSQGSSPPPDISNADYDAFAALGDKFSGK